jgi:hypothetical protein
MPLAVHYDGAGLWPGTFTGIRSLWHQPRGRAGTRSRGMGGPAPPGVYLVRLTAAGRNRTTRVLLVR